MIFSVVAVCRWTLGMARTRRCTIISIYFPEYSQHSVFIAWVLSRSRRRSSSRNTPPGASTPRRPSSRASSSCPRRCRPRRPSRPCCPRTRPWARALPARLRRCASGRRAKSRCPCSKGRESFCPISLLNIQGSKAGKDRRAEHRDPETHCTSDCSRSQKPRNTLTTRISASNHRRAVTIGVLNIVLRSSWRQVPGSPVASARASFANAGPLLAALPMAPTREVGLARFRGREWEMAPVMCRSLKSRPSLVSSGVAGTF